VKISGRDVIRNGEDQTKNSITRAGNAVADLIVKDLKFPGKTVEMETLSRFVLF
jgi:hypothetical protein